MKAILAGLLALCAVFSPPTAEASPTDEAATIVCSYLDSHHSTTGVGQLASWMVEDGYTPKLAAEFMVGAVLNYCPRNFQLLKDFASEYGGVVA